MTSTAAVIETAGLRGPALARHPERRLQIAASLGAAFARDSLGRREMSLAIEIFKSLVRDTEIEVRRTLAEHVKASPLLPRSLALKLAQDIEAVALPVLQSSPVLTDDDLVAVIDGGSTVKQRAIAGRETLSERVSGALVETGERGVIELLLANDGAAISVASYRELLDAFKDDDVIQNLLVERPVLPFEVTERLVWLVSEALRERLTRQHDIPAALAEQFGRHGRERALVQSLAALRSAKDIDAAARRLSQKGALTPTLLLRALAAGQLELFGAGMAVLARVPTAKAQTALRKAGTAALVSLYQRAQLPAHLQSAFQIVLEVVLERRRAGHTAQQPDAEQRIVDALVRSYRQLSPDSLESMIYQLGRLNPANPDALRL
jgi:uncharacterized protein (DUF2336 family)